jgi:glycosyltransferase involved in cell wall biosynthesis
MYDIQTFPELLRGYQDSVKTERDSRTDRNSLATLPPIMHPVGNPPADWGPGRYVPYRRAGEFSFGPVPQYNPGSVEMEKTMLMAADDLVGLNPNNPLTSIRQQFFVSKFLNHARDVLKMAFKCYQRFGPDEVFFRVTGVADPMKFNKGNPDEDFDVTVSFDILNNDPDTQEARMQQFVSLLQLDKNGRINSDALLESMAAAIDPVMADAILQPAEQAQEQVVKMVTEDLSKIYAGIEVTQVWVPSHWGRDVLVNNGIEPDRIHVVPEGVNGGQFHPYSRQLSTSDRPFRFLSVGKYEQRKSFDETLTAFAQVYANMPNIELVIKSGYFTNHDEKFLSFKKKIQDLKLNNVTLLWGSMTTNDIAELYRSCDAFVFPTKGEGWGLPLIEAAASGLPIITVPYSGHTEFVQHIGNSVVAVDYVMSNIDCPEYCSCYPQADQSWGQWARPDIYSIGNAFQTVCREYKTLYKNAQKNSEIVRNRFSWQASVDRALVAIRSIAQI